jgi:hypothetical protein
MFETKKLFAIGLATFALACAAEDVCNDNLDNDENGLIDCADADQCGADAACAVAADAVTGDIAGIQVVDASVANGTAIFEIVAANIQGTEISVFLSAVSDNADICNILVNQEQVDFTANLGLALALEPDPAVAFVQGDSITGNGVNAFVDYVTIVVSGGALAAQAQTNQDATINFDKIGADGFVSANGDGSLVLEFSDTANFDTDVNADGVNDAKTIAAVDANFEFTNASECVGLAGVFVL